MKALLDLFHLLMCQKKHDTDMMHLSDRKNNWCYYYLENDISDGHTLPDHQEWEVILSNFKLALNLSSNEEALNFIREAISISQSVKNLAGGNKLKEDFINSLLI